jgi:uncharacterized membrane protein
MDHEPVEPVEQSHAHVQPHAHGRPHRPSPAGRWSAAIAVAVISLVAYSLLKGAFTRPTAVAGASGTAYGTVVAINAKATAATVHLDNGAIVQAQLDNGQGPGSVPALVNHYKPGDRVQLQYYLGPGGSRIFAVADWQRGPALILLLVLFMVVAAAVGRGKALRAVIATAAGLGIVIAVVVPAILRGANPVVVALLGSGGILAVAMYFVHGFNWKTTAALAGTVVTVAIALGVGSGFIQLAHITSFGTEESVYLVTGGSKVNIQGLVLTGVVIGALGALVDVTVGQASSVAELYRLGGDRIGLWELYERGMNVGLDHIGSLINTLVLAYVGSALPLIVLLARDGLGWQDTLNLELVGAQMVQTLVGAIALVLAVPFTTFVAATFFSGGRLDPGPADAHGHSHAH